MESQWRRVWSSVGSDRLAARWQMTRRRGRHSAKSKKLRQPCSTGAAWSCRRVIARVRPQAPYGARPACRIVPVSWGRLHRLGSSRSQRFEREGSPSAFGCLSSCPPQLRDGAQEVRGNSPTNVGKTEIDRVVREAGTGAGDHQDGITMSSHDALSCPAPSRTGSRLLRFWPAPYSSRIAFEADNGHRGRAQSPPTCRSATINPRIHRASSWRPTILRRKHLLIRKPSASARHGRQSGRTLRRPLRAALVPAQRGGSPLPSFASLRRVVASGSDRGERCPCVTPSHWAINAGNGARVPCPRSGTRTAPSHRPNRLRPISRPASTRRLEPDQAA